MRDLLFGLLIAAAFGLIAVGAATFTVGAGLIVGGLLLAVWSWLVLGDVKADE